MNATTLHWGSQVLTEVYQATPLTSRRAAREHDAEAVGVGNRTPKHAWGEASSPPSNQILGKYWVARQELGAPAAGRATVSCLCNRLIGKTEIFRFLSNDARGIFFGMAPVFNGFDWK